MKKVLLVAFVAIMGVSTINAQEGVLNGGVNVGIPTGDANDFYGAALGAELNYMFPVADGFTLGPSVQYAHFFGKDIDTALGTVEVSDASYLPISGAARFNVSDKFVVGANLGYAVGLSEDLDGGFYYRPVVGYKIGNTTQLNVSYSGISNDGLEMNNVSLGVMFGL
ncbi:transporter [Polaribacter sp. NJDZ03]|uniref:transporter n=1 Tax=Polaribacter sp. NJDZ03 TaxID=2855841 RepID=UPI001C4A1587|nr:transporter [Polaribacter sp. NJDZ03]